MTDVPPGSGDSQPIEASTETLFLGKVPPAQILPQQAGFLERGAAVGRYVILDRLGTGGMGVVYSAYDPELDRKVALKLLRPDRGSSADDAARLRLLREAQAIARLSHPNVIAVYDTGSFGDQVFIAMEFVEGWTLRQWLEETKPPWREILDRFLLAGRGLAAAHAAGLIHRDFKPDNVLLGKDDRVRVVDFGIARPVGELDGPAEERDSPSGSGSVLASPLTELGVALGTPAYMAPEQLRGEAADARTDQFSFCVSLYEALYGERPFPGTGTREILESLRRGTVRPEPPGSRVPARLRTVVLRGLRTAPGERYPSMEELLHALERDPAAVRRRWLAAAMVILVTGAVFSGFGYIQAGRRELCSGAEEKVAEVWSALRKREIHAAFLATRAAFAESVWRGIDREIDRYTRDWAATHRQACEATRVRGEQSEDLLDRKMFCLDQRLREVQAVTDLFTRPDVKVVEKAADTVATLPDPAACARAATLLEKVPPPRDPRVRERLKEAQAELAAAEALRRSGKYREALSRAEALKERVMSISYLPLQAEMFLLFGRLHLSLGEYEKSEEELHQAVWAAEAGRDDLLKTECWRELVYNLGVRQARYAEAHRLARHAEAALARTDGDPRTEAALLRTEATLMSLQGEYGHAVQRLEKARALAEKIDPQQPDYRNFGLLGATYRDMGEPERAISSLRRALEIAEKRVGASHPHVAAFYFNLGLSLSDLGRYGEAAGSLERALAILERLLGRDHPDAAEVLVAIGGTRIRDGQPARALPLLERALEIYEAKASRTPEGWAMAHYSLGEAARRLGRYSVAREHLRKALECIEEGEDPDSDYLILPLETLGALFLDQGRPGQAIPPLERALMIYERQPTRFRWSAGARFLLAQALLSSGREQPRALALARQAREGYEKIGEGAQGDLAKVKSWLADHGD